MLLLQVLKIHFIQMMPLLIHKLVRVQQTRESVFCRKVTAAFLLMVCIYGYRQLLSISVLSEKYFAYSLANLLATIWLICQCRRCKRHGFNPWMGKSPGEEHSIFVINKMPADQTPLLFAPRPCLQGARVHPLFLTASQAVHYLVLVPLIDSLQSGGLHLGGSQHQRFFSKNKIMELCVRWGLPRWHYW